jgi:hypothetical protein
MNVTMEDAIAAGDGTLHGAIDHWQSEAERLRAENKRLRTAMQEIADHHEDQRDCWANEWNADADQARYHEERRNLALWHLMTPNVNCRTKRQINYYWTVQ